MRCSGVAGGSARESRASGLMLSPSSPCQSKRNEITKRNYETKWPRGGSSPQTDSNVVGHGRQQKRLISSICVSRCHADSTYLLRHGRRGESQKGFAIPVAFFSVARSSDQGRATSTKPAVGDFLRASVWRAPARVSARCVDGRGRRRATGDGAGGGTVVDGRRPDVDRREALFGDCVECRGVCSRCRAVAQGV